jgi:inhibitor of cysteine peptidase
MRRWIPLLLLVASCSSAAGVSIDASADGTQMSFVVGDPFEVALAGSPTTGYTWRVASMDPWVLVQKGEPDFRAGSTLVGSGGTMILEFEAVGTGATTLAVDYLRPFEQASADDTSSATVTVTSP